MMPVPVLISFEHGAARHARQGQTIFATASQNDVMRGIYGRIPHR
jgi:hypothetical protein